MSGSLDDRVRDAEQLGEEWRAHWMSVPRLDAYSKALHALFPALVRDRERLQRIEEAAREAEKELRRVAASNFTPAPARCERYADKLHAALAVASGGEETDT